MEILPKFDFQTWQRWPGRQCCQACANPRSYRGQLQTNGNADKRASIGSRPRGPSGPQNPRSSPFAHIQPAILTFGKHTVIDMRAPAPVRGRMQAAIIQAHAPNRLVLRIAVFEARGARELGRQCAEQQRAIVLGRQLDRLLALIFGHLQILDRHSRHTLQSLLNTFAPMGPRNGGKSPGQSAHHSKSHKMADRMPVRRK